MTTSPTATLASASSHVLSASIPSLSSSISSAHQSSTSHISKTYRQSSTLFLTRRLPEALTTILPLISPRVGEDGTKPPPIARMSRTTRIKVWSLYLTILNAVVELGPDEGKNAFGAQEWREICCKVRDGLVWEEVVRNGYHGVEGDVDSDVVINLATLLLAHARSQILNQNRLENYLAAANSPNLDVSDRLSAMSAPREFRRHRSPERRPSGTDTPRGLNAHIKILELYTLHVLLRNNEWDYAREFISMNTVLDEERREAFLQALQSLQEEHQEADRREKQERKQQAEKLRRDLDAARKLRAENEEHERKRLEQERTRRERSEVDYGIDHAPTASSSGKSRYARGSSGISKPLPSTSKKEKAFAAPSWGARAAVVVNNVRALTERMGSSIQSNPMLFLKTMAFIIALLLMFSRKGVRERLSRVLGSSWAKVRATAGMGVKVSYI